MKQYRPWFGEKCLGFLDQKNQAKMQWVQVTNQRNAENLNNVRREGNRQFRHKEKAYLKAKIEELETNSETKVSETCIGGWMNLRRVTSLEIIW